MTLEELVAYFPDAKPTKNGYKMRCPAHDDRNPSLGIGRGDNGGLVMCCQAGCTNADILAAKGLTLKDLAPPTNGHYATNGRQWGEIVAVYRYDDERGEPLYEVCRTADKQFPQRLPGATKWGIGETRRVLFGLPELLASKEGDVIGIAEGEKDVLNLRRAGLVATSNPGGADRDGRKWREEYTLWLKTHLPGRQFLIFADQDEAGIGHAGAVYHSLVRAGCPVRTLDLEGLKRGEDISDWLARHSQAEFDALIRPPPHPLDLKVLDGEGLMKAQIPEPEALIPHLLYRGFSTLLAGDSKLGKSSLLMRAILALAWGGWWLDRDRRSENRLPRGRILFINFEDPLFVTRERALTMMRPDPLPKNLLTMEPPYGYSLANVLDWIHGSYQKLGLDAVVLDPIAVAAEWADEQDNAEITKSFKAIQQLAAETQLALLSSHHVTKKPGEYGLNIRGASAIKANVIGYLVLERAKELFKLTGINKLSGEWDVTLDRTDQDWSWWIVESRAGHTRTPQQVAKERIKADLLLLIGESPMLTTEGLAEFFEISRRAMGNYLEELQEANLIAACPIPTEGERGRPAIGWVRVPG